MKRPRSKSTYANVTVAVLAFVVLAGGTAFAATPLEQESAGANQLKKGAVTPAILGKGSKVTLSGLQGPGGPFGATGATDPQQPKGVTGDTGDTGNAKVRSFVFGPVELQRSNRVGILFRKLNRREVREGSWTVKLESPDPEGEPESGSDDFYPIPGPGIEGRSTYRVYLHTLTSGSTDLEIIKVSGEGEKYTHVILTVVSAD
jgi:hypothetical protein